MIEMSMGLFVIAIVIFFFGGGAVGWMLRGLRKNKCAYDRVEIGPNYVSSGIDMEALEEMTRRVLKEELNMPLTIEGVVGDLERIITGDKC